MGLFKTDTFIYFCLFVRPVAVSSDLTHSLMLNVVLTCQSRAVWYHTGRSFNQRASVTRVLMELIT